MTVSIWTEEELREQIAAWKQALLSASTGKSYTIGSRTLTAHDLPQIRQQLEWLHGQLSMLSEGCGAGPRFVRAMPRR